jgi:arylamine N-acetyltransferase
MAARPDVDRCCALRNNQFTVHHLSGASERRVLETAAGLQAVLEEHFRIRLPDTPELGRALQQIAERRDG